MKTIETPTQLSQVEPGMALSLDSAYCLNPSMANMAARHVPVTCQVRCIQQLPSGGFRVESVGCHLYDFPRDMTVTRLVYATEAMDSTRMVPVGVGERFKHVSIE